MPTVSRTTAARSSRSAREQLLALAVAGSLALVAACSGSAGPTESPLGSGAPTQAGPVATSSGGGLTPPPSALPSGLPSNPAVVARLTFDVQLTGAAPLSGSISRQVDLGGKAGRPCSDVILDDIFFNGPVDTHTVALSLVATDPSMKTGSIGLDVASSLTIDEAEASTFAPQQADTTRIVVNTDGTGHLDLSKWISSVGAMEGGTITWTCSS